MGYAGFRKNLTLLMQAKNLTEAQLSRELSVAQPTMHKLMSGATTDPRISTLIPIANYFGISIDQLLGLVPFDPNMVAKADKILHSSIKLPILPWEHIVEHRKNLSDLTISNWSEWIAVNTPVNKTSYGTKIKNTSFPAPFSNSTVLVIDPSLPATNGSYIVLKSIKTDSITIKRCLLEGEDLWLMAIVDGILPTLWKEDNWLILGVIVETYLSLYREGSAS